MGQGAGAIHQVQSCADIIEGIMSEAEAIVGRMAALRG
jgi:NAD(P)H-dependent flavin oxidoreductase YrpB (nitropropane dioxygenase family)